MATGRTIAWGPWLEQTVDHACSCVRKATMEHRQATQPRQGEHEEKHKQEHEHVKGHKFLAA